MPPKKRRSKKKRSSKKKVTNGRIPKTPYWRDKKPIQTKIQSVRTAPKGATLRKTVYSAQAKNQYVSLLKFQGYKAVIIFKTKGKSCLLGDTNTCWKIYTKGRKGGSFKK